MTECQLKGDETCIYQHHYVKREFGVKQKTPRMDFTQISIDIGKRKNLTENLNNNKTEAAKQKAQKHYSEVDKKLKNTASWNIYKHQSPV